MANKLLAFEDLRIGDNWTSHSREMTSGEIREFADLTGDFNRLHIDEAYAAETPFGEPIAHGLLGLSVLAGLSSVAPNVRTTALLDISAWRFRKPIFVGDEIHVQTEVAELRDRGRKHGEVQWYRKLVNQRGEIVQDGMITTLVERNVPIVSKSKKVRVDASEQVLASHLPEVDSRAEVRASSQIQ